MSRDAIDAVVAQWSQERPDLDLRAIAVVGRLGRLALRLRTAQEHRLQDFGLQHGEFDVLATLRRSGSPYTLTPSAIADSMLLSRAAMTSRLDRLESVGLITRTLDPTNRRSFRIALTDEGHDTVDRAMTAHTANVDDLVAALDPTALEQLDDLLARLLSSLEH